MSPNFSEYFFLLDLWVRKTMHTFEGSKLAEIHSWIYDFTRGKRIKNYEVICPVSSIMVGDDISKKDLAAFWWADPVHLTPLGYEKLGEQLSDKVAANKQKKHLREDSQSEPLHQRPRLNSGTRLPGVSKSDTLYSRWEKSDGQGGHNSSHLDRHSRAGGQPGQPGQRKNSGRNNPVSTFRIMFVPTVLYIHIQ